jgi:GNAT superfamily N-acetyltransferase
MPPSQTFRCRQLDASSLQDWLHLTSPLLRAYATTALASAGSDATGFLALALEGEAQEHAALLLAETIDWATNNQDQSQRLCVLSVVVSKPYRRQGLGRQLLTHAEDWAKTHQLAGVNLPVPLQSNSCNALLRLTSTDHGWKGAPGKVIVGLSVSTAVEALLQRLENVVSRQGQHASWEIAPFPEQQTEALQERISMAETGQLAVPWDPENGAYQWHPAAKHSRLLLHQDEIVGWLITHFVSPDCLRYAKFWVDPGWEHSGAPLSMLASVMRSAHFSGGPDVIPKGCFISHPCNTRFHHWANKLFKPVCDSWVEIQNRNLIF